MEYLGFIFGIFGLYAYLQVSTKSLKRAKEKKNRYKEVNICNTGRVFSNQTSLPVLYCLYFNKLVLVV